MKRALCLACVLTFLPFGSTFAQSWSEQELEVWKTIQDQWNALMKKDFDKVDEFFHESILAWDDNEAMPLNKEAASRWGRYLAEDVEFKQLQLSPVGFVVQGNAAVAHYYYMIATENKKGERETAHGRYTDVLVKTGDGWRFIAWSGGDNPKSKDE